MTLSEKVAYLKGVAEGLKFDPEQSPEGKLISIMMDILEHMALSSEETDDSVQALADQLDEVTDNLELLEDCVYGDEEDLDDEDEDDVDEDAYGEDDWEITMDCPKCGDVLVLDHSVVSRGTLVCPGCGQEFTVEVECEELPDDEDDDEDDEDN